MRAVGAPFTLEIGWHAGQGPRTSLEGPGSLDSAPLRVPARPSRTDQNDVNEGFGVRRAPGSLEFANLEAQTPLGVPPRPPRTDPKKQDDINGRGFGVLIIPD